MHCHMLHHVMTQMGHTFGNVIGMNTDGLNKKMRSLVPGYMMMGLDGMGDMGEMGMAVPPNSLPMVGGPGQHDYITMGGMFTILKVRDELPADGTDPAWYQAPPGTQAQPAAEEDLRRDGLALAAATARLEARGTAVELCAATETRSVTATTRTANARIKVAMQ